MRSICIERNCPYLYQDEQDSFPRCHFDGPDLAPCEYDDKEYEDYEDELEEEDIEDRYTLDDLGSAWW